MRASPAAEPEAEGQAAVRSSVGSRSLISSAWPRWFVANWISYPSSERPAAVAMMPALHIRMSRRAVAVAGEEEEARKVCAIACTEAREPRSQGRNVTRREGARACAEAMAAVARAVLRPLK